MINSVRKAVRILSVFSSEEPRLSLGEISRRLDLPKSTTHSLLHTLLSEGFIEQVEGNLYALGTAPLILTQSIRVNVELRDPAAPLLRELADATGESVYLTVRDHDYVLYTYAIESPRRLIARTAVGDRAHMHCTSVGKAILAHLDPEERAGILARTGLPVYTPATITDCEALARELADVRRQGFALDRSEHEPGIYCAGAPIFNSRGRAIGACSLSGVDPAIIGERRPALAALVVATAQQISRLMGYVPASVPAYVEADGFA